MLSSFDMESYSGYEIVEENFFQEKVDVLRKQYPRLEEVLKDVTWQLSRSPYEGEDVPFENFHRIYKTFPTWDTPSFWFLYRIDESTRTIYLISVETFDHNMN